MLVMYTDGFDLAVGDMCVLCPEIPKGNGGVPQTMLNSVEERIPKAFIPCSAESFLSKCTTVLVYFHPCCAGIQQMGWEDLNTPAPRGLAQHCGVFCSETPHL
jgi:hypothetical protein